MDTPGIHHLIAPHHRRAVHGALRGATISLVSVVVSRLLALLRDALIAAWFGQGRNTDIYTAAFQLPDLLFYLVAGGALYMSFVPVFIDTRAKEGDAAAWELFDVVVTCWTTVIATAVVVGFIFAPWLVPWVAAPPHWLASYLHLRRTAQPFTAEEMAQVVLLTRIVLPIQVATFSGAVMMGVQRANGKGVLPALAASVYTLSVIVGACVGRFMLGRDAGIVGMAVGGLAGAWLGNWGLQVCGVAALRPPFHLSWNWRHPGARRIMWLMAPIVFSASLPHVGVQVNRWFAANIGAGAISSLERAYRLMLIPVGMVGHALAIGFFTMLAKLAAQNKMGEFRATVTFGLRLLILVTLPTTALFCVLRAPIVAVVYQYGHFTAVDGARVAAALAAYAGGIVFWCVEPLLGRAFYAVQDTRTPVEIAAIVTLILVALNFAAGRLFEGRVDPQLEHVALAAATTIASGIMTVLLFWQLQRRVGSLHGGELWRSVRGVGLATIASAIVAGGAAHLLAWARCYSPLATLLLAGGLGAIAFVRTAHALHLPELIALHWALRRWLPMEADAAPEMDWEEY